MTQWIVAIGDPGDGFTYYGPFVNINEAIKWAEANDAGEAWTTIRLEPA